MNETKVILNAYYEALYDQLEAGKDLLTTTIEKLLRKEIAKRDFGNFDEEKYTAYRDACLAFVDERLEAYNPVGIQYTFDRVRAQEACELELQLNWYDSRAEFEALVKAARARAGAEMPSEKLEQAAKELVREVGAFPDKSIISAYNTGPALGKLPDYIVARAVEEIVR